MKWVIIRLRKNSSLNGVPAHDFCDVGADALSIELLIRSCALDASTANTAKMCARATEQATRPTLRAETSHIAIKNNLRGDMRDVCSQGIKDQILRSLQKPPKFGGPFGICFPY